MLGPKWERGELGYEEIFLPVSCLNTSGCRYRAFDRDHVGVARNRVVFKRWWPCEEVLGARRSFDNGLWHPVKDRACLVAALEEELEPSIRAAEKDRHFAVACSSAYVP